MTTLAIVAKDIPSNINIINKIRDFYASVDDFVILSDEGCQIAMGLTYSLLSSYYIRFLKGTLIFLDIKQYLEYKDKVVGNIILYLEQGDIHLLDKSLIGDVDILTIDFNDKPLLIRGSNV